jgi:DNA-binding HxlR family transcriptional regulator
MRYAFHTMPKQSSVPTARGSGNPVSACPLQTLSRAIGGKWKIAIIGHLLTQGPQRPGELRRRLDGISEKVLLDQLRQLAADGLVMRKDFQSIPPRVEYRLSDVGLDLAQRLAPLAEWSAANLPLTESDRDRASEAVWHTPSPQAP